MGHCMFFIHRQLVADLEILLDNVADRIQTTVSVCIHDGLFIPANDGGLCHDSVVLFEMGLRNLEIRHVFHIIILEDLIYPVWRQFFMLFVGHMLHRISHLFPHLLGNG